MNRAWFAGELEAVATFWRIARRDGVTLGFTGHDRDLWFDGVLHVAAPGMVPSAIHTTTATEPDSVEMRGALDHAAIRAEDLAAGRFDGAAVSVGVVDWETCEHTVLFSGRIGGVGQQGGSFTAELLSAKLDLDRELVPRTAPTCRAEFCGPGCTLSPARFTRELRLVEVGEDRASIRFGEGDTAALVHGTLRWIDGAEVGLEFGLVGTAGSLLLLDRPLATDPAIGSRALVLEGCDHTLETCATRFGNAINFQGEPFLPGNDLLTRYATPDA
jgi:uncharacterized phage protein (TIGR02218 family)